MPVNEVFGWLWILLGFLSGMVIGFLFHNEQWLGGYASHPRRLIRLGHISFVGLGILNILFSKSLGSKGLSPFYLLVASRAFIIGGISMPLCCGLMAWNKRLYMIFAVPVISLLLGAGITLWGLARL